MGIKAVETIRKIRDENYKRTRCLPKEERLKIIHEEAAAFLGKKRKSGLKTNITVEDIVSMVRESRERPYGARRTPRKSKKSS